MVPLDFRSPYGCSKGAADQYMLDYYRMFGVRTTVFRHSSMYGSRQFATYDQGWIGWFCQKAIDKKPIVHTDRGCHYRWPGWLERIERAQLTRSMSKKGCSPDNSACEGFFGRIKNEMFYGRSWAGVSVEEFIEQLNRYLEWYNERRIKVSLGSMNPVEYRRSLGLVS